MRTLHPCSRDTLKLWHLHLSMPERTFLLQQLYETEPRLDRGKTRWSICGQEVCKEAFCKVVGVTQRSLYNMTKGLCGSMSRASAPRDSPQHQLVNQFFLELYMSAAEPLPHEFKVVADGVEGEAVGFPGSGFELLRVSLVCVL